MLRPITDTDPGKLSDSTVLFSVIRFRENGTRDMYSVRVLLASESRFGQSMTVKRLVALNPSVIIRQK